MLNEDVIEQLETTRIAIQGNKRTGSARIIENALAPVTAVATGLFLGLTFLEQAFSGQFTQLSDKKLEESAPELFQAINLLKAGAGTAGVFGANLITNNALRYTRIPGYGMAGASLGRYGKIVTDMLTKKDEIQEEFGNIGMQAGMVVGGAIAGLLTKGMYTLGGEMIIGGAASLLAGGAGIVPIIGGAALILAGLVIDFVGSLLGGLGGKAAGRAVSEDYAQKLAERGASESIFKAIPEVTDSYSKIGSTLLPYSFGQKGITNALRTLQDDTTPLRENAPLTKNGKNSSSISLKQMGFTREEIVQNLAEVLPQINLSEKQFLPTFKEITRVRQSYGVDVVPAYQQLNLMDPKSENKLSETFSTFFAGINPGTALGAFHYGIASQLVGGAYGLFQKFLLASPEAIEKTVGDVSDYYAKNLTRGGTPDAQRPLGAINALDDMMQRSTHNPMILKVLTQAGISGKTYDRIISEGFGSSTAAINHMLAVLGQIINYNKGDATLNNGILKFKSNDKRFNLNSQLTKSDATMGLGLQQQDANELLALIVSYYEKGKIPENAGKKNRDIALNQNDLSPYADKVYEVYSNMAKYDAEFQDTILKFVPKYLEMNSTVVQYFAKYGNLLAQVIRDQTDKTLKTLSDAAQKAGVNLGLTQWQNTTQGTSPGTTGSGTGMSYAGFVSAKLDRAAIAKINPSLDSEFLSGVEQVAANLGADPRWLLAMMATESGFDPSIKSPGGGHVGLLQLGASEAQMAGTSQQALLGMTRTQQLPYVQRFFEARGAKKGWTLADYYGAVALPILAGKPDDWVLQYKGHTAQDIASHNPGWDRNKDGVVQKWEIGDAVTNGKAAAPYMQQAITVQAPTPSVTTPSKVSAKTVAVVKALASVTGTKGKGTSKSTPAKTAPAKSGKGATKTGKQMKTVVFKIHSTDSSAAKDASAFLALQALG